MNLSFKIFSTSFLITVFSLSLMALLTFFKYESTLAGLIASRFEVTVIDVAGTIRNGLALGVSLSELHNTQEVIEKVRGSDQQIRSIQVFELSGPEEGRTIYHTRKVGIGAVIPSQWKMVINHSNPGSIWSLREDGVNVIGTTILNKFNEQVGGIAVRYGQDAMNHQVHVMQKEFFILLGKVLGILGIALFLGSHYFFLPISRVFKKLTQTTVDFLTTQKYENFQAQSPLEDEFLRILEKTKNLDAEFSRVIKKMD